MSNYCYVGHGGHKTKPGGCVMEWVSMIFFNQVKTSPGKFIYPVNSWDFAIKTDHPICTAAHITSVAILINDRCNGAQRARLALRIPRLLRATMPQESQKRNAIIWRLVEMLDIDLSKYICGVAGCDCTDNEPDAKLISTCINNLNAITSGKIGLTSEIADKALDFLDQLLDQLDKAKAEEGCLANEDFEYPSDEEVAEIVELLVQTTEMTRKWY